MVRSHRKLIEFTNQHHPHHHHRHLWKKRIITPNPNLRDTLSNDIAALDDIALASNETVRNLGVIFDPDLSFDLHLKQISKTAFFHLRNISKIRNLLTQKDAEKLVHAFVTSQLDYCNSLLSGIRWWIMIVGAADHRLIAAGLPDI